ncbi:OmpA family protein [Methylibium petroleiphilum]|uniref:Outer membrane protein n=1 Tax=Methylibium petroleiphilum (strain ATCC BAA-1232 / LMG 22953 / PM1) TaxID=420662 RepID=A2SNJ9_METPP|nr:OmpA family protein [Methylibium petroleiphilum]ABM97138.1 outer membrane protein [Methylibium petroleiphilum PM1]
MHRPNNLLFAAALALLSAGALAADAREAQIPLSAGVALEPAHRAHVISPLNRRFQVDLSRAAWFVAEPAKVKVLLPAEERALLAARAAEQASASGQDGGLDGADSSLATPRAPDATVYFPFDGATALDLSPATALIPRVTQGLGLRLTGHADSQGSDLYNLRLSERRARAVSKVFLGAGISADRLEIEGRGERDLIDLADGAKNRRVEIRLVGGEAK